MCISHGVGAGFDDLTISLCMQNFGDDGTYSIHGVDRDGALLPCIQRNICRASIGNVHKSSRETFTKQSRY